MVDEELVEQLKKSKAIIGERSAIIVDFDGEVLSGRHRKEAEWTKTERIDTRLVAEHLKVTVPMAKEIVRTQCNIQRKPSREETQASLLIMAKELEKQGVKKEKIASEVAKWSSYTERWVFELLPTEYKQAEKVEAGKKGAEVLQQKRVEAERPRSVQCSRCSLSTIYPNIWQGQPVCGNCYGKLVRGQISLGVPSKPKPKPELEPATKAPKVEKRVYEPTATERWRERMTAPISRMDEYVRDQLSIQGINHRSQEPVCVLEVIPDVIIEKGEAPTALFLDGPVHDKHRDRDRENRELLRRKGFRILEVDYDSFTDEQKKQVWEKVKSAITIA